MSGSVGNISGTIGLDVSGVTKGASDAAESIEQFARRAKKMANDFAIVGGGITAAVLGIVSKVQGLDPVAHEAFEGFTNASQTLGIQIARVTAPALKAMADMLRDVANYLSGLSPETKKHIADLVVLAAQVGVAALVFGRLMEVLKGVTALFEGLMFVIGAIGGGPLLLILGVIVAIVAAVVVLRKAWAENWGGIQDATRSVITTISGWWASFANFLSGVWAGIVDDTAAKMQALVKLFYSVMVATGQMDEKIAGIQMGVINQSIQGAAGAAKSPMAMENLKLQGEKALNGVVTDFTAEMKKKFAELMDFFGLKSKPGAEAPSPPNAEILKMTQAFQAEVRSNALGDSQRAIEMGRKQRDFNNIGAPESSVLAQATAGFADYTDALKKGAAAAHMQAEELSQAKLEELRASQLDAMGAHDQAAAALDSATNLKQLAQKSGDMAEKADEAAKAFSTLKEEALKNFTGTLKIIGDSLTSNLGKLGTTINAGVQGFQQGGIWGMLAAVIMQFVTQAKGFTQIMNIGNGQFQMALNDMAKGLTDLFTGLKPLMGAFESIASAVHSILGPILSLIGTILQGIAPILSVVGESLQALGSSLGPLFQIIGGILTPIFKLMALTLSPLVIVFMYLKVAADGIALGFNQAVDWIDKLTGNNNAGGVASAQAAFDSDKAQADQFATAFLNNPFDALNALENNSADAAAQIGAMGDAANSVTQQLLNIPQGFKVALAEYTATAAQGGGAGTSTSNFASGRAQFLATGNPVHVGRYTKKR